MPAIAQKCLYLGVWNEIVRDLVIHIFAHIEKPSVAFVTEVAGLLVKTYPFMANSVTVSGVSAYVSGNPFLLCVLCKLKHNYLLFCLYLN